VGREVGVGRKSVFIISRDRTGGGEVAHVDALHDVIEAPTANKRVVGSSSDLWH
jgi:hypothetical protein